jgi:hypothetical protein
MGASLPPDASMKANRIVSDNFPPPTIIRVPFSGPTICPFALKIEPKGIMKQKSRQYFIACNLE